MPNSRRLKISSSLADSYDHTFEMSEDLPSNTYTEIEIEQFKNQYSSRNGDYIYRITVAGKQVHRVINDDPREFKNVKMYVSSPWYEPADVVIKDLKLDAPYYEVEQKQGRWYLFIHPCFGVPAKSAPVKRPGEEWVTAAGV